ncbi:MAG TPA: hypothetical protein VMN57_13840 [Anaerolineales bacterium]|nr:hypothetical protein [Anaerolineales bacterium]
MPETPVPEGGALTPELVKKIADRVYALLLADLRRERERNRISPQRRRKR